MGMLPIKIEDCEFFDERTQSFLTVKGQTLQLEHSLVSISKWESKWKKPFLSTEHRTQEETKDYIRCMTITQNVNPLLYDLITPKQIEEINAYMNDPMTATTIAKPEGKGIGNSGKNITSEEIYYYMDEYRIPSEYQKWHFNRLMTLIRIHNEKNKPKKKMRKGDTARRYRALNAKRRARYGSKG